MEFIEVYHGLPALWNVKSKDYSKFDKKGEQYDVLIEKYHEKYSDADKPDVVKKINSLRTNFRSLNTISLHEIPAGIGNIRIAKHIVHLCS